LFISNAQIESFPRKDLNFAVFVASPEDVEEGIAKTLVEFVEDWIL